MTRKWEFHGARTGVYGHVYERDRLPYEKDYGGYLVCESVRVEDAPLILAAPELLALLRECRERMIGSAPAIASLRERTDAVFAKIERGVK